MRRKRRKNDSSRTCKRGTEVPFRFDVAPCSSDTTLGEVAANAATEYVSPSKPLGKFNVTPPAQSPTAAEYVSPSQPLEVKPHANRLHSRVRNNKRLRSP